MKSRKGFTLIELLAVIVILAILMAIAIPKVTQYITKSRKDSFLTTVRDFADATRKDITSEVYDAPIGNDEVTIISLGLIKLETGGKKSPFNAKWLTRYSYVAVINVGTPEDPDYDYYICMKDANRYTVTLKLDEEVERDSIIRSKTSASNSDITPMCGTKEGEYKVISNVLGLEKYKPTHGWNATVYSNEEC